jgi:hypothetical protein
MSLLFGAQAMTQVCNVLPTLLAVRQFSDKHAAFTQGSLRHLIFGSSSRQTSQGVIEGNGLHAAIVRIGRKVLIDEAKFFEWVQTQGRI